MDENAAALHCGKSGPRGDDSNSRQVTFFNNDQSGNTLPYWHLTTVLNQRRQHYPEIQVDFRCKPTIIIFNILCCLYARRAQFVVIDDERVVYMFVLI